MTTLVLGQAHAAAIRQHIDSQPALEVCGLVGGVWRSYPQQAIAQAVVKIDNVDATPQVRFTMHPQQQLSALMDFEKRGWELVAIYHSHPTGNADPSATDIAEATYPDVVHLIGVPLGAWSVWRIVRGQVSAVRVVAC